MTWPINQLTSCNGSLYVVDIRSLNDGSSFVKGDFRGEASFGGINLDGGNSTTSFIAKLDSDGKYIWATQAGGGSYDGSVYSWGGLTTLSCVQCSASSMRRSAPERHLRGFTAVNPFLEGSEYPTPVCSSQLPQ